jgi:hypothetical protein
VSASTKRSKSVGFQAFVFNLFSDLVPSVVG